MRFPENLTRKLRHLPLSGPRQHGEPFYFAKKSREVDAVFRRTADIVKGSCFVECGNLDITNQCSICNDTRATEPFS